MQTPPKRSLSKNGTSAVPKRTSPVTSRPRQAHVACSESDSAPACHAAKTPTSRSPRIAERKSPRSPVSERKRPSKLSELESQITQLQDDLKKTKEQLASSEERKCQAEQEAEDAKKHSSDLTIKPLEAECQLCKLSDSEVSRAQKLQGIEQEGDQAYQSEFEEIQRENSALLSAMNEIQRLKVQLQMAVNSEAAQMKQTEMANIELRALEQDTAETLSLVESLKSEFKESEKSEKDKEPLFGSSQLQFETRSATLKPIASDDLKDVDSQNSMLLELAEAKARVSSLEETMRTLMEDGQIKNVNSIFADAESMTDLSCLHLELKKLRYALEASEIRYQEEQIKYTMQIQASYEVAESSRNESSLRISNLESLLKETTGEIANLNAMLIEKEAEVKALSDLNEKLNAELSMLHSDKAESEVATQNNSSTADFAELKIKFMDRETELYKIIEQNDHLKLELEKKEADRIKSIEVAKSEIEIARSGEQEALVRVGIVTEESDKTSRRAARLAEQLEATQLAKSEMEIELRRLRIQTEQWRKAAEAAATILTSGNNGRLKERSGSLDSDYNSIAGKLLNSPFSDDLDEESPKKKNNNMLRKIGGFLKKGQK